MSEVGDALKAIFARIGSFFDLFDLSFFVSGSVAFAALVLWSHLAHWQLPFPLEGWLKVLAVIMACYVSGLICFAFGRWVRIPKRLAKEIESTDLQFLKVLEAHGLTEKEPFKEYISRSDLRGVRRLYIRLWAGVRQTEELTPSLLVLNRYWVMAATYDGLATAVCVWAVVIMFWSAGVGISPGLTLKVGIPVILLLLLCAFLCLREAKRFVRNQGEELVATIALQLSKAKGNIL